MKRLALIDRDSGKVVNVIIANPQEIEVDLLAVPSDAANIGDIYDGSSFVRPEVKLMLTVEEQRSLDKLLGFDYNGVYLSVTKEDCDGMSIVSRSFELEIYEFTTIQFKNGANLLVTKEEFLKLEPIFLAKRAKFFTEG